MRFATTVAVGTAAALALGAGTAQAGATLDDVKAKGFVQCGVSTGLAGFSNPDDAGNWTGLDVDVCRAIAAALFGDAEAVKFTPLTAKERFTALQSGEIDVLSRNTTWTLNRDTALGLDFTGVTYYDGQGFMVPKALGVKSALELDGASVCVQTGTTTELNLADFFRANNMSFTPVVFESPDEAAGGLRAGPLRRLYHRRLGPLAAAHRLANPDDHIILPEIISKEPLGPVVRHGDNEWGDIVRWTLYAMIEAEELGVTSANVDELKANSTTRTCVACSASRARWARISACATTGPTTIIKQVGNYGEIFERNVGMNTPLKLERGLNALWTNGGLQYAMPMR